MEKTQNMQTLKIDTEDLRNSISNEYTKVVCDRNHVIHFTSGRPLAERLGYPEEVLEQLPSEAIRPFAGVGNPFLAGELKKGEIILDIGCGAGLDCLVASLYTDHQNLVYGLDMTPAMLEQARENAAAMGLENIRFIQGHAENIPLPEDSVDVVISNGVINLCVHKEKVFREIYRVLRPGGRFQIADVLLDRPVPVESRNLVHLWTNCVAGAIPVKDYLNIIEEAGFARPAVGESFDVFKDARVAKSAAQFGARGYNISGIKPC